MSDCAAYRGAAAGGAIEFASPAGVRQRGGRALRAMKSIFHSNSRVSLRQLGPLEQRLLEALWLRGTATVREVLQDGYQDLAYTTVMTTLDRLYKKNLLTREAEGRAFRYAPRVTREELHREVAGEAVRPLLDASPAASLPPSYLGEILTARAAQFLDSLRAVVETKGRPVRPPRQPHP